MRKISVLLVILFVFCGTIFGADGDVLWTRTYNDTDDGNDRGYGIAADGSGNVYVTGYEFVTGESYNIWVRKYDSDGDEVWTRTHNGSGDSADVGYGIAVDGEGNVYVTGYVDQNGAGNDVWVRKYDADGDEVWTKTYNGTSNGADRGHSIAVDGNGNVYVTGYEWVTGGGNQNIWVRKYNRNGNVVWTKTYNGTAGFGDYGQGIAVDGSGNVYVIGYEWVSGEGSNIWVRKYDSDGDVLWTKTHGGTANLADKGYGIAVDGSGNVYVTGFDRPADGELDNIWVRKYDTDGDVVWTKTHNGPDDGFDEGHGIAVDGSGNVYVIGFERGTVGGYNIWVRKYDSDGNEVWTGTYNDAEDGHDRGFGIAVDEGGNVYVTGYESTTAELSNIWVRKYEGPYGVHFEPPEEGNVKIQGGDKGYVNPRNNEKAKIHFQPSGAGRVNVKIYTLRGLLVWEGSKSVSGYQDFIEWNCKNKENDVVASGIYVVYIEGPGIKATKKVAILK